MRIRDIHHSSGLRLRLELAGNDPSDFLLQLRDLGAPAASPVQLDLYGGDLLVGFLLSARLANTHEDISDERSNGPFGCRLRLSGRGQDRVIELQQQARPLVISSVLWDRFYAELLLTLAHARHRAPGAFLFGDPACAGTGLLH